MLLCPAGHPSGTADWCAVCGRPIDPAVPPCAVCGASMPGRFCDECGADRAVPAASALVVVDPEWFAQVRHRAGGPAADLRPPSTPPRPIRLEFRRTVLGRQRTGRRGPDVDLVGDDGISTRHAALTAVDGGWTVTDLGSRNGTSIDRQPLAAHRTAPLPSGGVVRLGLWTAIRIEE